MAATPVNPEPEMAPITAQLTAATTAETAAHMSDQDIDKAQQGSRNAAFRHNRAGEDEQGNRQKNRVSELLKPPKSHALHGHYRRRRT